jgi:hypothetical protein
MSEPVIEATREIVELLVAGKYLEIEQRTLGERLTADDMRRAIEDYGRRLALPPAEAYRMLDAVQIRGRKPTAWSVRMLLWAVDEGRSDLSLELTIVEGEAGPVVELDDIHVL